MKATQLEWSRAEVYTQLILQISALYNFSRVSKVTGNHGGGMLCNSSVFTHLFPQSVCKSILSPTLA